MFGEAAEEVADFFGGDLVGVVEGATFGKFGESRGGGDGASATVSFPADVDDFVVFYADFDEHLVAADRVTDDAFAVGEPFGFVAHDEVSRV